VSDDWLDLPVAVSNGKPLMPPVPVKLNPRRMRINELKRILTIAQRQYATCLITARLNTREATRAFHAMGYTQKPGAISAWRAKPYFKELVELMSEEMLDVAGITPTKVLLGMDALAEYGTEVVVKRSKYGEALIDADGNPLTEMRDPHLALKAGELLGKKHKLWGNDDDKNRVVVNIVDLTGTVRARVEPIEAEDAAIEEGRPDIEAIEVTSG